MARAVCVVLLLVVASAIAAASSWSSHFTPADHASGIQQLSHLQQETSHSVPGGKQITTGPRRGLRQSACAPAPDGYFLFEGRAAAPATQIRCDVTLDIAGLAAACDADCECRAFDTNKCLSFLRGSSQAIEGACLYEATNLTARAERCGDPCPALPGTTARLFKGFTIFNNELGGGCTTNPILVSAQRCAEDCTCKAFDEGGCLFTRRGPDYRSILSNTGSQDLCMWEMDPVRNCTCPEAEGFAVQKGVDHFGSDLEGTCFRNGIDWRDAAEECRNNCTCASFNDVGCLKTAGIVFGSPPPADFCWYKRTNLTGTCFPPSPSPPPPPPPSPSPPVAAPPPRPPSPSPAPDSPPPPPPGPLPTPTPTLSPPPPPGNTNGSLGGTDNLPPPPSPGPAASPPSSVPVGAIAGGVAGGVAVLGAAVGTWLYMKKKRGPSGGAAAGAAAGKPPSDSSAGTEPNSLISRGAASTPPASYKTPFAGAAMLPAYSAASGYASADIHVTSVVQQRTLEGLRIPWSAIVTGKLLGRGGFGSVYKGRWQSNEVAVKMLEALNPEAATTLRNEALVMCELRHPCIAQVYGMVDDGDHLALVMKYYKGGNMSELMKSPLYDTLPLDARLRMVLQVATGMCRLHEAVPSPIVHGDLKTSNLLLEEETAGPVSGSRLFRCYIADFGLSSVVRAQNRQNSMAITGSNSGPAALTIAISPPEVLSEPRRPREPSADVWAFGIVMLEMLTGRQAYPGLTATQVVQLVLSGQHARIPDTLPQPLCDVIAACLSPDPGARPSFTQLVWQLQSVLDANSDTTWTTEYTMPNY